VEIRVPAARLAVRDTAGRGWRRSHGVHRIRVARHATDPAAITLPVDLPPG
jgi:hypothetical protein